MMFLCNNQMSIIKGILLIASMALMEVTGWIGPLLPGMPGYVDPNNKPRQSAPTHSFQASFPLQQIKKKQNEQSIFFLPQISQYSIVNEVIYPSERFKIKRTPENVIKELKQKIALEQNAIIAKSNQNLNKLNTQFSKVVQKQEKKVVASSQMDILKKMSSQALQSYQKPNKEEDKKKNSLIQEIKKQLAQQEQIRKQKKKQEEQKKKQEEEIKKFDEEQKQIQRKKQQQQNRQKMQKQKMQKAREQENQRKKKINHERFMKQQQMQMKHLDTGFNTGANMISNNKMLQLRLKQMQAQRREDQIQRKNSQIFQRQRKLKMEAERREDQANKRNQITTKPNNQQKNISQVETVIKDYEAKNAMQSILGTRYQQVLQKKKIQQVQKQKQAQIASKQQVSKKDDEESENIMEIKMNEQDQIKQKALQSQFQRLDEQNKKLKDSQLRKQLEQMLQPLEANKKDSAKAKQPLKPNAQVNKNPSQQVAQAKSKQVGKSTKQPFRKQIQQHTDTKKLKQELQKRIKEYEQQKKKEINTYNVSNMSQAQPQQKQQRTDFALSSQLKSLDVDNLQNRENLQSMPHSELNIPSIQQRRQKFRQQDTDDQLYEQLQARRKASMDKLKQKQKTQNGFPHNSLAFSDIFVYCIFGFLISIVIFLRANSPEEQEDIRKISSRMQYYNRGSLLPDDETDI